MIKLITFGEYSDYSVVALLEWRAQISARAAYLEFLATGPEHRNAYRFVAWLIRKGYAVEADAMEFNVPQYPEEELEADETIQGRYKRNGR